MNILFYIAAMTAIISTLKMVTGTNAVHALLYLIVSLLAVSVLFFLVGAPFIAALEVIVYAGAIMVLFVFVIMMLNMGPDGVKKEKTLLSPGIWIGPSIISVILLAEMVFLLFFRTDAVVANGHVGEPGSRGVLSGIPTDPAVVGQLLFTKYIIAVELAGFLLTGGIIGAYHLGEKEKKVYHRFLKKQNEPS